MQNGKDSAQPLRDKFLRVGCTGLAALAEFFDTHKEQTTWIGVTIDPHKVMSGPISAKACELLGRVHVSLDILTLVENNLPDYLANEPAALAYYDRLCGEIVQGLRSGRKVTGIAL
jgi:hypothetical protein